MAFAICVVIFGIKFAHAKSPEVPVYTGISRNPVKLLPRLFVSTHSLCFGVYDKGKSLVGFARVVIDFSIFAYLMDVFVLEEHRKRGLGKQLMEYIIGYPDLQDIRFWRLDTNDAHGLYKQ